MPSKVSDIHEISVLIGFEEQSLVKIAIQDKFKIFSNFVEKYGNGRINISSVDFYQNKNLFSRGLSLSKNLKENFNLKGKKLRWTGAENHKEDSSDIYVDDIGISLKDSSKIIRNSGFEQLIETFCKTTIKKFKDPFLQFAPKLSVNYLTTVINDCYSRGFLKIKNNMLIINGEIKCSYNDTILEITNLNLKNLTKLFKKTDIKELVKDFSKNGELKNLLKIRTTLIDEVSKKVVANLAEGLAQNPEHFTEKIKYMLQYRKKEKLFGFSSQKEVFSGKIKPHNKVIVTGKRVFTSSPTLTKRTTGLQINIYTDIIIEISGKKEEVRLQNQLRYKHRTFSCAPEANFHLLHYSDWKKIYPQF